jgi:putative ABC transport system permease protein
MIKRVLIGFLRHPFKNVLSIGIFSIIFAFATMAFVINSTIFNVRSALLNQFSPVVTIGFDNSRDGWLNQFRLEASLNQELWTEEQNEIWADETTLNSEIIQQIINLPQIRFAEESSGVMIFSREFQRLGSPFGKTTFFSLHGAGMADFSFLREGAIEISYGRTFSDNEISGRYGIIPLLASETLALENNWVIGEKLLFEQMIFMDLEDSFHHFSRDYLLFSEAHYFKLIGFFNPRNADTGDSLFDYTANESIENLLIAPLPYIHQFQEFFWTHDPFTSNHFSDIGSLISTRLDSIRLTLYRSDLLPQFIESATILLPLAFEIQHTVNVLPFISIFDDFEILFQQVLIGALIGTGMILILLNFFFFGNKKYEMAIYLSLGERKIKLYLQLILEMSAPVAIALLNGLWFGYLLAQAISERLIIQNLISLSAPTANTQNNPVLDNFKTGLLSIEEIIGQFNISFSAFEIIFYLGIFLTLVVFVQLLFARKLVNSNLRSLSLAI